MRSGLAEGATQPIDKIHHKATSRSASQSASLVLNLDDFSVGSLCKANHHNHIGSLRGCRRRGILLR
jgi:hypothetical protein